MRISRELLDDVIAHAREEAPNECCGLVGGVDGRAATVYRARNKFASPTRFEVHPDDLFRITDDMDERGETVAALYHSHVESEAQPSQTDINLAQQTRLNLWWPDLVWLICSLAGEEPDVRGFRLRDGRVEEVELVVE